MYSDGDRKPGSPAPHDGALTNASAHSESTDHPLTRADSPSTHTHSPSTRDGALDLLRCIALIRIVFWHLFAQTWMTWFAAVPVLFFVAGSVLERPGRHTRFLARRLRRVLLPLWVYAAGVALASIRFGRLSGATPGSFLRALTWLLPVVDPTHTGWDAGWLSNHLWYLRAYLWILLLAPLLVWLSRRILGTAIATVGVVVGLEIAARAHLPVLGFGSLRVAFGDTVVYGFFAVAGIRYRVAPHLPRRSTLTIVAVLASAGSVMFARIAGLPAAGVNGSYPAIMLVGCAAVAFVGVAEGRLRTVAAHPRVRRVTRAVSSRSLTVYLWHPVCIVVSRRLLPIHGAVGVVALILGTAVLIVVAVAVFGWVENVASQRTPSKASLSRRRALGGGIVASLVAAAVLPIVGGRVPVMASATNSPIIMDIPAPSAREALGDAAFAERQSPAERDVPVPPTPTSRANLSVPPSDAPSQRRVPDTMLFDAAWADHPADSVIASAPQVLAFRSASSDGSRDSNSGLGHASRPIAPNQSTTIDGQSLVSQPDNSRGQSSQSGQSRGKSSQTQNPVSSAKQQPLPTSPQVGGPSRTTKPKPRPVRKQVSSPATRNVTTTSGIPAGYEDSSTSTASSTSSRDSATPRQALSAQTSSSLSSLTSSTSTAPRADTSLKATTVAAVATTTITSTTTRLAPDLPEADLQRALDVWRASASPRIPSMIVGLRSGTKTWAAKSPDGGIAFVEPEVTFPAASLTKTFTAALVLREVEKGTLSLDSTVPAIRGLEVPLPQGVTVRRLLTHTAGLVDYAETPTYRRYELMTPLKAVNLSFATPQKDGIGVTVRYNNSGYLYLGLLLEQVTGKPYVDLIAGLADDADLKHTTVDVTPHPGWIGFSSGGVVSTVADLATWGQALFGSNQILSARNVSMMTTLGDANIGIGAWPACPCWTDTDGVKRYTGIGHYTAIGGMFYFPATGLTIVAMFDGATNDFVSLMDALTKVIRVG